MVRRRIDRSGNRMTRTELITKERARRTVYSRAFWIIFFAALTLMFGWRSLSSSSAFLGTVPQEWLVGAVFVAIFMLSVWNQMSMARCPHCRKPLDGAIAIATDRCARCSEIAVDDPRSNSN